MNTILIILIASSLGIAPPKILHKSFSTAQACEVAKVGALRNVQPDPNILVVEFCVKSDELLDQTTI